MGIIEDVYGLKTRKKFKLAVDLIIFLMFITSIFLVTYSFREGFRYAENWYLQNCICIGKAPTGEYVNITPPQDNEIINILMNVSDDGGQITLSS